MNTKEAAKVLYFSGWKQKEIARMLKVAERTVSHWKRSNKWDEQRERYRNLRNSAADKIMELINYQLEILTRIKKFNEAQLEPNDIQQLNKALIQNGQIDALYKMFAAVKTKEITWATYVRVIREFHEYLLSHDIELAKKLTEKADEFLNSKRHEMSG